MPGDYDVIMHAHNDYLTVLVNSGVPGLLAFLSLWFLALRESWRTWRRRGDARTRAIALGAGLSVVGLLISGCFQNYYGTFINCLEWWFLTGLIFSAGRLAPGDPTTSWDPATAPNGGAEKMEPPIARTVPSANHAPVSALSRTLCSRGQGPPAAARSGMSRNCIS